MIHFIKMLRFIALQVSGRKPTIRLVFRIIEL